MTEQVGLEVQVFDKNNPTEMIAKLPYATEKKFLDEINGNGGGSFVIHKDDPALQKFPNVLDSRNVVKLRDKDKIVSAFVLSKRSPVEIDSREHQSREETVSGEGLNSWFNDAQVASPAGNTGQSYDSRSFNFASPRDSWYNADDWMTPLNLQQKSFTNTKYRWGTAPAEWPDAPGAWFVWNRAYGPLPNYETAYFRYEFTTGAAAKYKLFAAADDEYTIYVDGQEIYNGQYHYETSTNEFELQPGNHVIGFRVMNKSSATNNPAALIAAFFQWGDADAGTAAQLITQTGDAGWQVSKPGRHPGWSPGEIVRVLFSEAADRDVWFPSYLNYSFTDTHDSKGVLWETPTDASFRLGEKYGRVMEQLYEQGIEYWIDPDTYTLHMAPKRGKAKGQETVKFRKGKDLIKVESAEETVIVNHINVKTKDGWLTLKDTASQAKYGVIEETLEIDAPSYKANRIARQILEKYADPERTYDYKIEPQRGSIPWVDFEVGDWILSDAGNGVENHRVVSISVEENSETGVPEYSVELDSIFKAREDRLSATLEKLTNGILGGSLETTGPVAAFVNAPGNILAAISPEAPQNLSGTTSAFWSDRLSTNARVVLTWNPVEESENGDPANLKNYKVYSRYNVTNAPWNLMAEPEGESVTLEGFKSGETLQFSVTALSHGGAESARSNVVTVTMPKPLAVIPAPTDPTISTRLGNVILSWDGMVKTSPPSVIPEHASYVYAEMSTTSDGTYTKVGQTLLESGDIVISDIPIGETRYFRLGLVDRLGTESAKSGVVSTQVVGVDFESFEESARQEIENIASASGKAQVIYSVSNPPTSPDPEDYVEGTTWFRRHIGTGAILGQWRFDGTTFQPVTLSHEVISSIDAGKITVGEIDGGLIQANTVTAGKLAANSVTAAKIESGAITSDKITSDWITGKNIVGSTITTDLPGASNRTYLDNNGLTVYSGGSDQVKIGHGLDTGMSVRNPSSGQMQPLAPFVFGTQFRHNSSSSFYTGNNITGTSAWVTATWNSPSYNQYAQSERYMINASVFVKLGQMGSTGGRLEGEIRAVSFTGNTVKDTVVFNKYYNVNQAQGDVGVEAINGVWNLTPGTDFHIQWRFRVTKLQATLGNLMVFAMPI